MKATETDIKIDYKQILKESPHILAILDMSSKIVYYNIDTIAEYYNPGRKTFMNNER